MENRRVDRSAPQGRPMENIEYQFILKELDNLLGRRFNKIYFIAEGRYRIKLGDISLSIDLGMRINASKFMEEGEEGDGFVQGLRKELEGSKLISVKQINNDRIIAFEFDGGTLVYEGFAKGNLVLVRDGKTLFAVKDEEWKDRKIKRGVEYNYPKSNVKEKLEDALSEKYIISALLQMPLGKEYAKEILSICKIEEKKPGNTVTKSELGSITSQLDIIRKHLAPVGFYKDSQIVDYGLIKFSKYSDFETKSFETLSEVADLFYLNAKEERNVELDKLQKRLEEQEARLVTLNEEEKELKAKGDFIYSNYEKVESLLAMAEKTNINDLENKLPNAKINKKEKEIELELD